MNSPSSPSSKAAADNAQMLASAAKAAAPIVANATTANKNAVLQHLIAQLQDHETAIINANQRDLESGADLTAALKDRLHLNSKGINDICAGIAAVAALSDPVGEISDFSLLPSGIRVGKMRAPLGVLLAIYESRPNVTADIAALAIKSGNAVILRGGSEAQYSNAAIGKCLSAALTAGGLPPTTAQVATNTERALVDELLSREEINLTIPRGGRGLIERVARYARMPVLKHLDGNCHVYVDAAANLDMAHNIVINAKTRRYGVCNAAESMLVHQAVAAQFLPSIAAAFNAQQVEIRGCEQTRALLPGCQLATEEDWRTEYLAPIISVKIVSDVAAAIAHINRFGSGHTDAIVSDSVVVGERFLREVDSSSVMLNASTAFADGGEYGLGTEVGISTDKFHARGPVGLAGLTCQKYIVVGQGAIRT